MEQKICEKDRICKNNDFNLEFRKQQKISDAYDKPQSVKINHSNIIDCRLIEKQESMENYLTKFSTDSTEFNAQLLNKNNEIINSGNRGDKCYAVIYEFNYAGRTYTIIDSVYKDYNAALNNKKSTGDEILFKFKENNLVERHRKNSNKYIDMVLVAFKTVIQPPMILLASFIGFSLFISVSGLQLLLDDGADVLMAVMVFSFNTLLMSLFYCSTIIHNYSLFNDKYAVINNDLKEINNDINKQNNTTNNNKSEYKSVTATYNITNEKLIVNANKLDCSWIFKRNEYGQFSKEGQLFIKNIDGYNNNECSFTIKNNGCEKSDFCSSCGNWWIIEDSL